MALSTISGSGEFLVRPEVAIHIFVGDIQHTSRFPQPFHSYQIRLLAIERRYAVCYCSFIFLEFQEVSNRIKSELLPGQTFSICRGCSLQYHPRFGHDRCLR